MSHIPKDIVETFDPEFGVRGWVVLDTLRNGMAFGGCRVDPSVNKEDVMQLARCMTLKLGAHGFPVGGAKGGLCVDPKHPKIRAILKNFGQQAQRLLKTHVILGKDLGATNEMLDTIYQSVGVDQMHVAQKQTGRIMPARLRELTGYRQHMTGLGVASAVHAAIDGQLSDKRVLIQGFGAVGVGAAVHLRALGASIHGVSDANIALYNKDGFPLEGLLQAGAAGQLHPGQLNSSHEVLRRDELLCQPAEVLVLAATSNCIDAGLASEIRCPVVVEGANFALLPEARKVLFQRNILVVPDVLANSASGAMVALQMASGNSIAHDDLWQKIVVAMRETVNQTMILAREKVTDLRTAYIEQLNLD